MHEGLLNRVTRRYRSQGPIRSMISLDERLRCFCIDIKVESPKVCIKQQLGCNSSMLHFEWLRFFRQESWRETCLPEEGSSQEHGLQQKQ